MSSIGLKSSEKRVVAPDRRFGASHWKHIFKLIGLIVVANGKVVKEELDTYQDVMIELAAVIDPKIVMTRKMAFDWFVHNKSDLVEIIDSLAYEDTLIDIFSHMRHLPQKLDVLTAMVKVAIADSDYGPKEELFIKKTILFWNVRGNDVHEDVLVRSAKKSNPAMIVKA